MSAPKGLLDSALSKLCDAATLDPKNPLARYEKAAVLQVGWVGSCAGRKCGARGVMGNGG